MLNLNELFKVQYMLDFLRRQNVADYWDENKQDDILRHLSLRQINYLLTIKRYGPCSLQTVMHYTRLSSSAVSAAVDKLVKLGVIERVQNSENRREVLVSLTPDIQTHLERIDKRFRSQIEEILSDCNAEEAELLNKSAQILSCKLKGSTNCFEQ